MYWLFCQKKKTSGQPWWVLCTRIHKANLVSDMNKNTEGIYTYITSAIATNVLKVKKKDMWKNWFLNGQQLVLTNVFFTLTSTIFVLIFFHRVKKMQPFFCTKLKMFTIIKRIDWLYILMVNYSRRNCAHYNEKTTGYGMFLWQGIQGGLCRVYNGDYRYPDVAFICMSKEYCSTAD
jgi:hypothetical protein